MGLQAYIAGFRRSRFGPLRPKQSSCFSCSLTERRGARLSRVRRTQGGCMLVVHRMLRSDLRPQTLKLAPGTRDPAPRPQPESRKPKPYKPYKPYTLCRLFCQALNRSPDPGLGTLKLKACALKPNTFATEALQHLGAPYDFQRLVRSVLVGWLFVRFCRVI